MAAAAAEMAGWLLARRAGCTGVETASARWGRPAGDGVLLRAYFSSLAAARRAARDVAAHLPRWAAHAGLSGRTAVRASPSLRGVAVDPAAWRKARASALQPVRVGGGVIAARGRAARATAGASPGKAGAALYRVVIPPGMAFGTGHHPTTQQALWCLELALKEPRDGCGPGALVVDVGTGSGVLAVAARVLGADRVVAVDTDPLTLPTARQNARRNGATSITFRQGSVASAARVGGWGGARVVVANLLAETLVELAGSLARLLAPGGLLIGAGITQEKAAEVVRALEAQGLTCEAVGEWSNWAWVAARRGAGVGCEPAAGAG